MDVESTKLLREILDVQREQSELLRKYFPPLWRRIRFSLLALLLLMTLVAGGLGFTVYTVRSLKPSVPPTITLSAPSGYSTSPTWSNSGTLRLNSQPTSLDASSFGVVK